MTSLLQDLRFSLRTLSKNLGFTAITVLTLGLGIGANTAIFSLLNGTLLRPFPYGDADRLLYLRNYDNARDSAMPFSFPEFFELREQTETLEHVTAFRTADFNLSGIERPMRVAGARVSAGLFDAFEIRALEGRTFQPGDDRPGAERIAVISEDLWRSTFGARPALVGESVRIDGEPHTVVGVVPAGFNFPVQGELWTPLTLDPNQERRGNRAYRVAALLRDGATLNEARAELNLISGRLAELHPESNTDVEFRARMFRDHYVIRGRTVLYILQAVVFFVLLITCANVANLQLVRGAARGREVAIRTAVGATRPRLLLQFLTESVLLAVLGGVVGLVLAHYAIKAMLGSVLFDIPFWIQVGIDARVLLFTFLMSFLTGFIFGLVPAFRNSRIEISETLKEAGPSSQGGLRRQRLFKVIVVAEMAFTIVLLICAGLMIKSFQKLQQVDPGFDPKNVLTVQISDLNREKYPDAQAVSEFYARLEERIVGLSSVEAVGANDRLPLRGRGSNLITFQVEGSPDTDDDSKLPFGNAQVVTPKYFDAMGLPVRKGRAFDDRDAADRPVVVIVNQKLASRFWPDVSPIGKRIRTGPEDDWMEVIGVAADVKNQGLDKEETYDLYFAHRQRGSRRMTLVVRSTAQPSSLISPIRNAIFELDKDQPIFNSMSLEEVLERSLWLQRFSAQMLFVFGAAALILACVGLYGVISYSVSQRQQEMGIRMALGASRWGIVKLIVTQSLWLVAIGMLLGLPLALFANRFLARMYYGLSSAEIPLILGLATVLGGVGLLASLLPAYRTGRIKPVVALRYE